MNGTVSPEVPKVKHIHEKLTGGKDTTPQHPKNVSAPSNETEPVSLSDGCVSSECERMQIRSYEMQEKNSMDYVGGSDSG